MLSPSLQHGQREYNTRFVLCARLGLGSGRPPVLLSRRAVRVAVFGEMRGIFVRAPPPHWLSVGSFVRDVVHRCLFGDCLFVVGFVFLFFHRISSLSAQNVIHSSSNECNPLAPVGTQGREVLVGLSIQSNLHTIHADNTNFSLGVGAGSLEK